MHQKKLVDMTREELLEVVFRLCDSISRKRAVPDLPPNRAANARHQYHKHTWGRKKQALLGLLHRASIHCPGDLLEEIEAVLHHEENHYQRRHASTERKRRRMLEEKNGSKK